MSRIIAAVDDSVAANPVVAAARLLAPVFGADVEAVNVADVEGRTAAAAAAGFGIPFRTTPGDPLAVLVALAAADDVVGFVIGQSSHVAATTTGHLALGLADSVDKPVLVVSPRAVLPNRIRRVLVAMEGVPGRTRELKRALALAAGTELELVVVHVDDESSVPSFSDQVQYETEAYAEEFLARYAPGTHDVRLELRIGAPADQILCTCDEEEPDVLAMGWPHGDRPGRGDVVRAVLEHSSVPVLLVATR
jgi:nucleotide-binding universal stress UspA family protein